MPNWVYTTIAVKGTRKDVFAWLNKARKFRISPRISDKQLVGKLNAISQKENGLSLYSFIPIPKTYLNFDTTNNMEKRAYFKGTDEEYRKYVKGYKKAVRYQKKKYGVVGWYDWNHKFLGCKWNAYLFNWSVRGDENNFILIFNCDTPWNIPNEWISTMQEENDNLTFFCRAQEEGYCYNGYFCARDKYWDYDDTEVWQRAKEETLKERPDLEEDSDEFYDHAYTIEEKLNNEINESFYEFVENYEGD